MHVVQDDILQDIDSGVGRLKNHEKSGDEDE